MKRLLTLIFLCVQLSMYSQICTTTVLYDNMETYTWFGDWWIPAFTTGFPSNASVSPTLSGRIYGAGNASSGIDQDWYSMPNVTGLNASYTYKVKFRLASYRFSNPTATTAGVDAPDYITVQLSTNGGASYVNEIRITGFSNAYWDYNSATISKTANGILSTYAPITGGNRTSTGDGYSVIELTLPAGSTQCAVDIYCRINSAGEEWWLDNVELIEIAPCSPLPIELLEFVGHVDGNDATLSWETASEINSDYYDLQKSDDGVNWNSIATVQAAGNSTQILHYSHIDRDLMTGTYYYRLKQVDFNGVYKIYDIISVIVDGKNYPCTGGEYYNLMGQKIDIENVPSGIYIRVCNGKADKIYKVKD